MLTLHRHVHVGYGRKGFHPYILSNLFAILWTFNEHLDMLHPKARRTRGKSNHYCPGLRTHSVLGKKLPDTPDAPRKGLKKILRLRYQDTNKKFVELMNAPSDSGFGLVRLAYNAWNLKEPMRKDGKITVEFRGHEGTMSSERIVNWINVCVGLVEFAETVDGDELSKFLWSHIDDDEKDFTVIDVLRAIGRPAEAEFYARRFQEHPELLGKNSASVSSSSLASLSESPASDITSDAPSTASSGLYS